MSTLTKLFIVLHVVLSMLVAAGLVVFVNTTQSYKNTNASLQSQLTTAKTAAESARNELTAGAQNSALAVQAANAETTALRAQVETANRGLLDAKGQVAQANAQLASVQASLQGAQAAVAAGQGNQGLLQSQLIESRKSSDDAQKKLLESNLALTDMSNRVQVLERQNRNQAEELAALQEDGRSPATAPGGSPRSAAQGEVNATTAGDTGLNINGVVRTTQTIAGIKYATISVGSADAVRKGMKFRVLGGANGGQFLGYVTVTSVEPHESVGRLDGPRIGDVANDNQVRTRL